MNNYLTELSTQLGISLWLLIIIFLWCLIWKLLALWKSARKGHVVWFIILALVNTVGILPILYIYIFSDLKLENKTKKKTKGSKTKSFSSSSKNRKQKKK